LYRYNAALFPDRRGRGAALMCLPRLKLGVYTDWEAMSTPSAGAFSAGTYWRLWDDDARHMLRCLRRALEASLESVASVEEYDGESVEIVDSDESVESNERSRRRARAYNDGEGLLSAASGDDAVVRDDSEL
jgi:hypothetical protein